MFQVFLDHRPREEVTRLVSAKTNGATPLVLSCRNGHHDVVEYLVDKCCASVEQPGSVTFDGETIEGAPPLWCAAAAGTKIENIFYAPVDTLYRYRALPLYNRFLSSNARYEFFTESAPSIIDSF